MMNAISKKAPERAGEDPDILAVRAILSRYAASPSDGERRIDPYMIGSYDHLPQFQQALAAYRTERQYSLEREMLRSALARARDLVMRNLEYIDQQGDADDLLSDIGKLLGNGKYPSRRKSQQESRLQLIEKRGRQGL